MWHHIEENHINFSFLFYLERQVCREKVGDMLTEKILYIAEVMNRHEYVPKMPNQSELDLVFDTSYPDVQPYLFRVR
jgi:autophagy-related protein 101